MTCSLRHPESFLELRGSGIAFFIFFWIRATQVTLGLQRHGWYPSERHVSPSQNSQESKKRKFQLREKQSKTNKSHQATTFNKMGGV